MKCQRPNKYGTPYFSFCRFFATGSFYHAVGDMHGPSKATVCRVVRKVANLINTQLGGAIKWPTTAEEHVTESRGFYAMAGVPDVIGRLRVYT